PRSREAPHRGRRGRAARLRRDRERSGPLAAAPAMISRITSRQRLMTLAAYVTVALCWSGSWTAGKLGVASIPPFELSTIRFAIVIAAATGPTFTGGRLAGDLLLLGGAACWSVYAILGAINTRHGSPLGVTAIACLAGAAMLFPLGFLEHGYADVPTWPLG